MNSLRQLAAPRVRAGLRAFVGVRTRSWGPATRLFVVGEGTGWSVDEDAKHLEGAARRLGYTVAPAAWARFAACQAVFVTSQFEAMAPRWLDSSHRLGVAYLHGRPGTPGMPEFDAVFETLCRRADRVSRVHVTHTEIHDLVLEAGVEPDRVFRIPLGVDLERFPLSSPGARLRSRQMLGLPASAFVVGSFQKDGVGWGEGLEPKLIKGPDVLVDAVERLRRIVPELAVLLTGPARGWVRRELERRGIPHWHVFARSREELASAYRALDVYLVTSRQEGGPKAALEAMASGIPLVSTGVGQVPELVEHGRSGFLVDVEDAESLAYWASRLYGATEEAKAVSAAGRATAEMLALERLDERWGELLRGFVERPSSKGA